MLRSLSVTNFALIENAYIEFSQGLNVLTGETGAGKSILIDALGVILGNRASQELIRQHCDFFRVEAVFELSDCIAVKNILEEQGISFEDDTTLILSRKFSITGKNTIVVNGCQITLNILRLIGSKIVDMHGQHDNQALLNHDTHLLLLDGYDDAISGLLQSYQTTYKKWQTLKKDIQNLEIKSREIAQRVDMLTWQTKEIASAKLKASEEETLEKDIRLLANVEKISNSVQRAYSILDDGETGLRGVLSSLRESKRELANATRFDLNLNNTLSTITEALLMLEECSVELRTYLETLEFDPDRLAKLQERMDIIYALRKKYGSSIAEVLQYYEQATVELDDIGNIDEKIPLLRNEVDNLEKWMKDVASQINLLRNQAGSQLSSEICQHLAQLGMPKANLMFQITPDENFTLNACRDACILFSSNAGEDVKPLAKIASGGELSRVALAIKAVCAQRDEISTMVFDEIDSGIGGVTAQMVAERIAMVAAVKQVLCITHLPQIASMADCHLYIEKKMTEDKTITQIRELTGRDRTLELVRMTSGEHVTETSIKNAEEMLKICQQKKEIWKNRA